MAAVTPLKRFLQGFAYWAAGDFLPVAFGGTGGTTQADAQSGLGLGSMATQAASGVAITGGTIDGAKVGATTPATGAFTTLSCSGNVTFGPNSTTYGAFYYNYNTYNAWFGIYDNRSSTYFGVCVGLPAPAGTSCLGGYYTGLGIGGSTSGTGKPIFGVLTSKQSGNGKGSTALTIYDTNVVVTFNSTLDDGAGNMAVAGKLTVGGLPVRTALVVNPASPYAAQPYDDAWCSTASAAQTVTLPASPAANTVVGAMRSGANPLTVGANGNTIAGTAADLVIDQDKTGAWLRWDASNTTWQVELRTRA